MVGRSVLGRILAYCGSRSIVIYLAFACFMAVSRIVLVKVAPGLGVDLIALAALIAGVVGPLILAQMVNGTRFDFLFKRPERFRLSGARQREGAGLAGASLRAPLQPVAAADAGAR